MSGIERIYRGKQGKVWRLTVISEGMMVAWTKVVAVAEVRSDQIRVETIGNADGQVCGMRDKRLSKTV